MKAFIVVDMQKDFIDGSLGTKEAVAIVPLVAEKVAEYKKNGYQLIYTRDTHFADYLTTPEGKKLPVEHCIKGTRGWEIVPEVFDAESIIIDKLSFGYTEWKKFDFSEIVLVGLCTDICVVSNALILKALFPDANISVLSECCAGVTPDSHNAALSTMKMCQIDVL